MSGATYLCTLDYTEAALNAERRLRRGERQLYCWRCETPTRGGWVWPDQCDHPDRLTIKQYFALQRRVAREVKRKYPSQEQRYRREMRARAALATQGETDG